jgi:hypothetical protein
MRLLVCLVIFMLCALQPVLATYPIIETSINSSSEGVVYTYKMMNVSQTAEVYSFGLDIPESVVPSIISLSGPTTQWRAGIHGRPGLQWYIIWFVNNPTPGIQPGSSGCFTLVTSPGIPTSYDYAPQNNTNWAWSDWDGVQVGGNVGNTILPVPVPEPSSILALIGGITGLGGFALKRRRS